MSRLRLGMLSSRMRIILALLLFDVYLDSIVALCEVIDSEFRFLRDTG
jgi:hypothetical protein